MSEEQNFRLRISELELELAVSRAETQKVDSLFLALSTRYQLLKSEHEELLQRTYPTKLPL